ncbi:hypothetical protein NQ315_000633 [Exocentrus adspersus]|uniref:Transposase n=1 Tax=Exocentrus adspersus TaxID=1586481 RepID=A0AAV8VNH9_9CUCU|nr:hypothetical protein NQ315_000633 [Exocentrus adspersus]
MVLTTPHGVSVRKWLKDAKMHSYKIQLVHELNEDDPDRRLEYCERMMTSIDNGLLSLEWVLFPNEATFTLHGHVNRHNCRYWADENPQWMRECYTQRSQKTNVWAGIVGDRILVPVFFIGNIKGRAYLPMLQNDLIPALIALFPNEVYDSSERAAEVSTRAVEVRKCRSSKVVCQACAKRVNSEVIPPLETTTGNAVEVEEGAIMDRGANPVTMDHDYSRSAPSPPLPSGHGNRARGREQLFQRGQCCHHSEAQRRE